MFRLFWIWPAFVALAAILIFSRVYRKKEKVDKGFVFAYWRLSYRRKFIRTLWMIPVDILVVIGIHLLLKSPAATAFVAAVAVVSLVVQAVYTYRKWKEEEAEAGPDREERR